MQEVRGSIPRSSTRFLIVLLNTQGSVVCITQADLCGVIAQLGERLHGMQEVRGSIPRSSTKFLLQEAKGHRIAVAFCFLHYLFSPYVSAFHL